MARIRTIKPAFFLNNELAKLTCRTRLLFIGLWTISDRRGFVEDIPEKIRAQIFPYERIKISKLLDELTVGFIERISFKDARYIRITNFCKHQIVNRKEIESTVPEQLWNNSGTVPAQGEQYNCITGIVKQEVESEENKKPSSSIYVANSVSNKNDQILSYTETVNELLKQEDWHNDLCLEFEIENQFLLKDMQKFLSGLNIQGQFPRKLADTKKHYYQATKKYLMSKVNNPNLKVADYVFGEKKL